MHQDLKYDLYGVVEHSGLPNFGHYVCTIRSSPTSWHLMNDSLVSAKSRLFFLFMSQIFHLFIVTLVLQVDSVSETSALGHEAYILFYVRQGSFPWFSNMQEEATKHQTKVKKQKAASLKSFSQDQISSRLMRGMMAPQRRCFVKRLDSLDQNASFGY
jgi:ubiquitin carboxyl-terminal hydrolase 36/42